MIKEWAKPSPAQFKTHFCPPPSKLKNSHHMLALEDTHHRQKAKVADKQVGCNSKGAASSTGLKVLFHVDGACMYSTSQVQATTSKVWISHYLWNMVPLNIELRFRHEFGMKL